jgi:hypothetical protein
LPLFTSASSEIFRKVPDRVQIDTTLNRQNPVQNHAVTGRRSELNRTAVVVGISWGDSARNIIEPGKMAHTVRNRMIGAGRIAADAKTPDHLLLVII